MNIKAVDYILPLVAGKSHKDISRFVGTAFYLGAKGVIATSEHIISSINNNEILMAYDINLNKFIELKKIIIHPSMDFAIARIGVKKNKFFKLLSSKKPLILLGTDIFSFGYINTGRVGSDLKLEDKLFKGYISFIGSNSDPELKCRTVCELSFPVLTGFSGAPVFWGEKNVLIGMLYGNRESDIEVHSSSETKPKQKSVIKPNNRSKEFGLMHTVDDMLTFLDDMKVKIK